MLKNTWPDTTRKAVVVEVVVVVVDVHDTFCHFFRKGVVVVFLAF